MADASLRASGIYAIRNTVNGKMYVGSAVNLANRFKSHRSELFLGRHHSQKLQRAWIKYGAAAFEFTVLEYVPDKSLLIASEQTWIDRAGAFAHGYNCCPAAGSSLGRKASDATRMLMSEMRKNPSAETRAKMSASHMGKKLPGHVVEMLRAMNTGKTVSEETRKKLSEFRKSFTGWHHTEETRGKIGRCGTDNWNFGKKAAAETREKISSSLLGNSYAKGFKHTEETRAKVSAASSGRRHSEATRMKMSESAKAHWSRKAVADGQRE